MKTRKFHTFGLIPPPKNYCRNYTVTPNVNNPLFRSSLLDVPPHVQIRQKLNSLQQKERGCPVTSPIPRETSQPTLPGLTESD